MGAGTWRLPAVRRHLDVTESPGPGALERTVTVYGVAYKFVADAVDQP